MAAEHFFFQETTPFLVQRTPTDIASVPLHLMLFCTYIWITDVFYCQIICSAVGTGFNI